MSLKWCTWSHRFWQGSFGDCVEWVKKGTIALQRDEMMTASWTWLCCICSTQQNAELEKKKLSLKRGDFHQPVNLDAVWLVSRLWPKTVRFAEYETATQMFYWACRPSVTYFQLKEGCSHLSFSSPQRKLSPCCAKENPRFPVLVITVRSCWILSRLSGIIISTLLGLIRFTQKCWLSSRE